MNKSDLTVIKCRFCSTPLRQTFVDLGMSPIANDYVKFEDRNKMEPFYPLHTYVCSSCLLVQLPNTRREDEIFTDDYAYFSSFSASWLVHSKQYVEMMIKRFGFSNKNLVVEVASNDGYLLQYFKDKGIPVLGIEPCKDVADAASLKGISTLMKFFGEDVASELAAEGKLADLVICNNVLAHVPDLNDFIRGLKTVLKPDGIVTIETPHLYRLMRNNEFDTIYHEHFSYYSLITLNQIFDHFGLKIFDIEEIPTHGGSLRVYTSHAGNKTFKISQNVSKILKKENETGLDQVKNYTEFGKSVLKIKRNILEFLIRVKNQGKIIVGYGAPAKGNTFLNYCGIRTDFLDFTVDKNPHKQNHFLPGVRIPVYHPDKIREVKPDYVLILPWNIKEEVMDEIGYIKEWGGKFVIAIPHLEVIGSAQKKLLRGFIGKFTARLHAAHAHIFFS